MLPLALAYLTNATGTNTGRKKRDLIDLEISDDYDASIFLNPEDDLESKINESDAEFFPTLDALLESSSYNDTVQLTEFVRKQGLSDSKNTCLEKMSCFASIENGHFKRSDSLKR